MICAARQLAPSRASRPVAAALQPWHETERQRYTDDEQEEGKYQVGRCATVPLRVAQRPVDVVPVTGIVDQQHGGHSQPAQRIQGNVANVRVRAIICVALDAKG